MNIFSSFFTKAKTVAETLLEEAPQILTLVLQVEGLFGASAGVQKKTVVLDALSYLAPPVLSQASTLIDDTVSRLNAAGLFKHATLQSVKANAIAPVVNVPPVVVAQLRAETALAQPANANAPAQHLGGLAAQIHSYVPPVPDADVKAQIVR